VLFDLTRSVNEEVEVLLEAYGNPGIAGVSKELAEEFKTKEDLIVVQKLGSSFGRSEFKVEAKIYDNAEAKASRS